MKSAGHGDLLDKVTRPNCEKLMGIDSWRFVSQEEHQENGWNLSRCWMQSMVSSEAEAVLQTCFGDGERECILQHPGNEYMLSLDRALTSNVLAANDPGFRSLQAALIACHACLVWRC